jgi:hypothetical protein
MRIIFYCEFVYLLGVPGLIAYFGGSWNEDGKCIDMGSGFLLLWSMDTCVKKPA